MELVSTYGTSACDGCRRYAFVLRVVDDAKLCEDCAKKSALIDQRLAGVQPSDPVDCDGCSDRVEFDARVAIVVRECGGAVLCDLCKSITMEREAS
jgi:hypothetical protein